MKDLFSAQAGAYKDFRPHYPNALFQFITQFVESKETAWDCATGNGQAATALASYFKKVVATDISASQLTHATPHPNVEYLQCPAEKTPFKDKTFDLVTVAQAYHWLQPELFANEVKRVSKPNAVIAVWLYDRFTTANTTLNSLMDHFYFNIVGPYWDPARRHIDDHYRQLPFPYEPIPAPVCSIDAVWTKDHVLGYLSSWSAVQKYKAVKKEDPIVAISKQLETLLGEEAIQVQFPVYLKLGRVK